MNLRVAAADGGGILRHARRSVALDADDLIRRDVIQKLMCNFELEFAAGTVAMRFDPYLREAQQKAQYSRVI